MGDIVRLNFSGSGASVSIGIPGFARINLPIGGSRKPSVTVSAKGTGISHTQRLD